MVATGRAYDYVLDRHIIGNSALSAIHSAAWAILQFVSAHNSLLAPVDGGRPATQLQGLLVAAYTQVYVVTFDGAASIVGYKRPRALSVSQVNHDGAADWDYIRVYRTGRPCQGRCSVVCDTVPRSADVRVLLAAVEGDGAFINDMGTGQQSSLDFLVFEILLDFFVGHVASLSCRDVISWDASIIFLRFFDGIRIRIDWRNK